MQTEKSNVPAYVIKAEDLIALNFLPSDHPHPRELEWINRATDQKLRPTSVDMLMRTLFQGAVSPSVARLHQSSGLRACFRTDQERERFAAAFAAAQAQESATRDHQLIATFDERDVAERTILELKSAGVATAAILLLWRVSKFIDPEVSWTEGHSITNVFGATAGGGIAGAVLGVAVLSIPGFGQVAAAGAVAASAYSSIAAVGGVIGATGAALARMLTDFDVDGREAAQFEENVQRGKVFVSIDIHTAGVDRGIIGTIITSGGGKIVAAAKPKPKPKP